MEGRGQSGRGGGREEGGGMMIKKEESAVVTAGAKEGVMRTPYFSERIFFCLSKAHFCPCFYYTADERERKPQKRGGGGKGGKREEGSRLPPLKLA